MDIDRFSGDAVLLEAQSPSGEVWWKKSLSPPGNAELERLRKDGHAIRSTSRRHYVAMSLEANRSTQLYRTLLHEIGHHVDWMNAVRRPSRDASNSLDTFERLTWSYLQRPARQREDYAHRYADTMRRRLEQAGHIPFERILLPSLLTSDGLRLADFLPNK